MKWLVENWSLLVVVLCGVAGALIYVKKFSEKPTHEQLECLRQWLLYAVIEAEKDFGSGTGALKLRAVYSEFCQVFPELAQVISFTVFSSLVDEALERMKNILEVNKDIEAYVEGDDV